MYNWINRSNHSLQIKALCYEHKYQITNFVYVSNIYPIILSMNRIGTYELSINIYKYIYICVSFDVFGRSINTYKDIITFYLQNTKSFMAVT